MAANSATAEKSTSAGKMDLELVSRKSAVQPTSPANQEPDAEAQLKKLADEITTAARSLGQPQAEQVKSQTQDSAPAAQQIRPRQLPPQRPYAAQQSAPQHPPARKPAPNPNINRAAAARAQTAQQQAQRPVAAPANMPVPISDVQRWKNYRAQKKSWYQYLPDIGLTATGAWVAGSVLYLGGMAGWENIAELPAHYMGSIIAGIAAPIALIWMGIHYARRDREIKEQMAPLLHQIDQLVNPNKKIEARVDAVADALRRQANELINAANQVEKTLGNVRQGLRADMEKMMEYAGLTGKHLEQASVSMSNRTSQLARLTEQMHGRLQSFEEHAKTGSDRLDQSVSEMMSKAQVATDRLERQSNNIIAALHAANMRMSRTADDLDSRISQVANFADQTAVRFGEVAAEFGRQGAIVDAAASTIESQMKRAQEMLAKQILDMSENVGEFGSIGDTLYNTILTFRDAAQQVVDEAAQKIQIYTGMMEQRVGQAGAALDRTAAISATKISHMDSAITEQLAQMKNNLRDAAAETPRVVQAIVDETMRRLSEMDMRFASSGGEVADRLGALEQQIDARLMGMIKLAERMRDDATGNIRNTFISVFDELQELKTEFAGRAEMTQRDLKIFHNDLAQTIEALAQVARRSTDRTVERILTLNAGISQRIMDLRNTAEQANAQGRQLEGTMAQHIGMLREVNDGIMHGAARMQMLGAQTANDLRDASGQAIAQAEVLSYVVGREADALREVSAMSIDQLYGAAQKMETVRGDLHESVSKTAREVSDAAETLNTQWQALSQSHTASLETHAALYDEMLRLREATSSMNAQVAATISASDVRTGELRALAHQLNQTAEKMEAAMQRGEMTLSNSAALVEQVGMEARDMMLKSGTEMVEASSSILKELRDAMSAAMTQAEVLTHVIGREADSLKAATQISAQTLDESTAAVEVSRGELYASVMAAAEQIGQAMREMEGQRAQLAQAKDDSAEAHVALYRETAQICDAIATLNRQISETVITTDGRANDLRAQITRLGEVTMGMKAVLQTGHTNLMDGTEVLTRSVWEARNALTGAGREITETASAIDGATAKLQDAVANVTIASETSIRDLDWLCGTIQAAADSVERVGGRAYESIQSAREALVLSEASLQRTATSARVNLNEMAQRYRDESGRLHDAQDNIHGRYAAAISQLEQLGQQLAGQSFHAFDSLSEIGTLLDARIAQLRDGGGEAAIRLEKVANELQQNYIALTSGAEAAARQLSEIQATLAATNNDLGQTTNYAGEQVDVVRRKLGSYAQDLMMMVSQAAGQMDSAASGFGDKANAILQAANENAAQLGSVGSRVRLEIEQLVQTVREATTGQAGNLATAVERLRQQVGDLTRDTQQSMTQLEQQGARATQNLQQMHQAAGDAARRITESAQQLMHHSEGVAKTGADAAQRIGDAAQQVQSQSQYVRAAADGVVSSLSQSGEQLTGKVTQWQSTAQKVHVLVHKILEGIGQQMRVMDQTITKAEDSTKRITQAETRSKREAFLNAAKFIIESLNSLSIDLTRVLDPEEADRVWKDFARGDGAAFTRRFLAMREELPVQKLKEKYERDNEFRTYVLRYFRQFEELFEQALSNDHNDLLATTLTTSDVGKLYSYLAGALGHAQLKAVKKAA